MSIQRDPTFRPAAPYDPDARDIPGPYIEPEREVVVAPAAPLVVGAPVASVAPVAPVIDHVVVQQPAVQHVVATSSRRRYAFDSVVVGIIGIIMTILGLVAVTRAGIDGPFNEPIVEVLGFTHTATLGLLEVAFGVLFLICATTMSRSGATFFGIVLGIAAFVGAVQTESFDTSLALESGLAWIFVIAAAIVVAVSLLVPRMVTRSEYIETV